MVARTKADRPEILAAREAIEKMESFPNDILFIIGMIERSWDGKSGIDQGLYYYMKVRETYLSLIHKLILPFVVDAYSHHARKRQEQDGN